MQMLLYYVSQLTSMRLYSTRDTHALTYDTAIMTYLIIMMIQTELLPPWQRGLCFGSIGLSVCFVVCLSVDNITKKVINGFGSNFMEGSWVVQGRIH